MKQLPIIRHVRWWMWNQRVEAHYRFFAELGYHDCGKRSDRAHLEDIWKGRA